MRKNSNGAQAIVVLCLIAIILIGTFAVLKPKAILFHMFTDNTKYENVSDSDGCRSVGGSWEDNHCLVIASQAQDTLSFINNIDLIIPIILIVGLIFYLIMHALRRDPQDFQRF